jgi:acyl carrier protein
MAEDVDGRLTEQRTRSGIGTLSTQTGLAAVEKAMGRDRPYVAVLPIRWSTLLSSMHETPPFLSELETSTGGGARGAGDERPGRRTLARTLAARPQEDWKMLVVDWMRAEVAAVVGLSPAALDPEKGIASLGLDSLMALEVRNRIEVELGVLLPATRLLEHPSVAELASDLLTLIEPAKLVAFSTASADAPVEGEI